MNTATHLYPQSSALFSSHGEQSFIFYVKEVKQTVKSDEL